MSDPIEFRDAQRDAFCRGCDDTIKKGQPMVATFSWRNRGQNIYFCVGCAGEIGALVKDCHQVTKEAA